MNKIVAIVVLILCCWSVTAQIYHIGDLYTAPDGSQGIVFYVTPEGAGWVVALQDASDGCAWGDLTDVPGLVNVHSYERQQMMSDTSGFTNTLSLRNYQNDVNSAAFLMDFDNGWMLPTSAQLYVLYGQLPFITSAIVNAGGTLPVQQNYWSSVENSATSAWCLQFTNGAATTQTKSNLYRVRAVRALENPALQYSWSNGATGRDIQVSPSQTTAYTVTVTSMGGQSASASQTVVVACRDTVFLQETVCNYFVWMGDTLTHTGDYTRVFQNEANMDSVVTLRLKVVPSNIVVMQSSEDTICLGGNATMQVAMEQPVYSPTVAIGDILCTDNSIVKPSDWPMTGKTALGVVFYVDYSGEHGWAVHLNDQSTSMGWGFEGIDIPSLPNYDEAREAIRDLNGYVNTQKIRAAGDAEMYPAAWNVDLDNGWYLPAAGQLSLLTAEWVTLNASLQLINGSTQFPMNIYPSYWSSTEFGSASAWYVTYYGNLDNPEKYATCRIRSIRDF